MSETASQPEATPASSGLLKKARKRRQHKTVVMGRPSVMTAEMWTVIREMYETGNYTQRDLTVFLKSRNINVSQSAISRRAMDQGWIKGVRLAELREEVRSELLSKVGDSITRMLETHRQQAQLIQSEALQHFSKIQEARRADPSFVMPSVQIATLTETLKKAQEMEARAIGFNYKEGKPYSGDKDDEDKLNKPKEMVVRQLTPEEEIEIQKRAEQGLSGNEDEE